MKLSDAFIEKQEEPVCEVKVKFTNIRGAEGLNLPVVQKCDILKQYCEFMEIMLRYKAESKNLATRDERKALYKKALQEAISKNILADYLTRKGTEVINMFDGEYDYELDIQAKTEDAREEGITQGQQQKAIETATNMINEEIAPEVISRCTGLPVEKVLELQKEVVHA